MRVNGCPAPIEVVRWSPIAAAATSSACIIARSGSRDARHRAKRKVNAAPPMIATYGTQAGRSDGFDGIPPPPVANMPAPIRSPVRISAMRPKAKEMMKRTVGSIRWEA